MPKLDLMARQITAIIPTWMRPENVPKVIASIRAQTVASYIFVWDNGAAAKPFTQHDLADCVFSSSLNWGCWARFAACAFVRTPYVWQMDDDLIFTRPDVIEKYIAISKQLGDECVIGAGGKLLAWDAPPDRHFPEAPQCYHAGVAAPVGPAVMVNTGFTLFPTALMNRIPMNPPFSDRPISDEELHNADDPWICSYLKTHVADLPLDGNEWYGIARLSECGMGVSHDPLHMHRRNLICWKYLKEKKP